MRKYLMLLLVLTLSLTACDGKKAEKQVSETQSPSGVQTQQQNMSPEGLAWRDAITKTPKVAEVEYKGTKYQVHVSDSIKYALNTATNELTTGTSTGDAKGTVLKDWVSPYEQTMLKPSESIFKDTWEYTSSRVRGLIGYCDANYTLITRARTSDYLEYVYQDKTAKTMYRIAVTNDYILYAPLAYTYVFDVNAY